MATNFPTTIDSYSTKVNDPGGTEILAEHINDPQDAIVALQTKVGVNSSAVTTSLDYLLKNSSSVDPGHKHSNTSLNSLAHSKLSYTGLTANHALIASSSTAAAFRAIQEADIADGSILARLASPEVVTGSWSLTNVQGLDIKLVATPVIRIDIGGSNGRMLLADAVEILFNNSSSVASGFPDIGLIRGNTGELKITDGDTGFGDLQLADLILYNVAGSGYSRHKYTGSGSYTYTWPSAGPTANYYLKTDGSGNLTWDAGTGGGTSDHSSLLNLDVDDHEQYVLRQPDRNTVINDSGADYDFRIEGDTNAYLFSIDAGYNSIGMGAEPSSIYRLFISTMDATTQACLFLQQAATVGGHAIYATSAATDCIFAVGAASGRAGRFSRNSSLSTAEPVFLATELGSSGGPVLHLQQATSGGTLLNFLSGTTSLAKFTTSLFEINPEQLATVDFKIWADTAADPLFFVDASENRLQIYTTNTYGVVNIENDAIINKNAALHVQSSVGTHAGYFYATDTCRGLFAFSSSREAIACSTGDGQAIVAVKTSSAGLSPVAVFYNSSTSDAAPLMALVNNGTAETLLLTNTAGVQFAVNATNEFVIVERSASPSGNPDPGYQYFYALSDGLYCKLSGGTVIGPFGTGGGGSVPGSATTNDTLRWSGSSWVATSTLALTSTTASISVAAGGNPALTVADTGGTEALRVKGGSVNFDFSGTYGGPSGGKLTIDTADNAVAIAFKEDNVLRANLICDTSTVALEWITNAATTPVNPNSAVRLYRGSTGWINAQFETATEYWLTPRNVGTFTANSIVKQYGTGPQITADSRMTHDYSGYVTITPSTNTGSGTAIARSLDVVQNIELSSTWAYQLYGGRFQVQATSDCSAGISQSVFGLLSYVFLQDSVGTWGSIAASSSQITNNNEGDVGWLQGGIFSVDHSPSGSGGAAIGIKAISFGTNVDAAGSVDYGAWGLFENYAPMTSVTPANLLRSTLVLSPESDTTILTGTLTPTSLLHLYRDTSGQNAWMQIENDNDGDSFIHFLLSGTKSWSVGIDNSDGDKFVVSESSTVGTNNRLILDGESARISSRLGIGINPDSTVACQVNGCIAIPAMTAPSTDIIGFNKIYVDVADGDLKIRFSNGTVKTIETN
jgi:hypothetical protein